MEFPTKLKLEIINALIMMAGIKGFVKSNYKSKTSKLLDEASWSDSIVMDKHSSGILIEISIAISQDINAKNLCSRIDQNIEVILKKYNKKLSLLNIYIRKVL